MTTTTLIIGGLLTLVVSFVGGIAGFGFALLCAPALLLLGLPLQFVVTLNLFLVMLQRVATLLRLRHDINLPRVTAVVLGSIPGIVLGSWLAVHIDAPTLKRVAGVAVMFACAWQFLGSRRPPPPAVPGAPLVAGFLGGVLGTTTSLSGPPVVILLARDRVAPRVFQADLAFYFVVGNAISLALLAARGAFVREAIFPTALYWLPGVLLGNALGVSVGTRLNDATFRRITYAVAFVSGLVTAITA